MKSNQRFDPARLAEVLSERGMCEPQALHEALQLSSQGREPFTERLVTADLVSDWELSRVVCEIYSLPFLPVDVAEPDPRAQEGLDKAFLIEHGLVPISRFGQVLTLAMPALVPADVLGMLAAETDLTVVPIVGTVRTNRAWIEKHLQRDLRAALPSAAPEQGAATDWGTLFDAADAAVLLDLHGNAGEDESG